MKQTWRWFGPEDPVTLKQIRQAGAEAIITSLHHIPSGSVWPRNEIRQRISELSAENFTWEVVESLPVHEAIKTGSEDRNDYIERYILSLRNLAAEGIRHVVYNFMALTDWTRTDLEYIDTDGARTIRFDQLDLAVFDLYILQRNEAEKEYCAEFKQKAKAKFLAMSQESKKKLTNIILMGLPGTVSDLSLEEFSEKLEIYHYLGKQGLRKNLAYFLEKVIPIAEKYNITMSIHADDPPFSILGLPRVVSDQADLEFILNQSTSKYNALCFCTGTLGAGPQNNVVELLDCFAPRISFVHLRNVKIEETGFFESKLFEGSLDMTQIARTLVVEQKRRGMDHLIPFRPDHGQTIMDDAEKNTYPGYPLIGRLKALAELRGLFMALK